MSTIRERGYTLIELLVVIALLAGLSTVLLIDSTKSRNLVQLQTAAQSLESALTQAQSFGNSGRAFPVGSSEFDSGYGVYLEKDSDKIIIYGGKGDFNSDGSIVPDEEKYNVANIFETITLGGGVTISDLKWTDNPPTVHEAHILFRRGQKEVHIHGANASHTNRAGVIITLETGGVSIDVYVYKTGFFYIDQ